MIERNYRICFSQQRYRIFFFPGKVCSHSLTQFWDSLYFFFPEIGKKKIQVYFFFPEILYASLTQHIFRRLCEIWPKFVLKLLISVDYCFFCCFAPFWCIFFFKFASIIGYIRHGWDGLWFFFFSFKQYSGWSQNQLNKRGIDVVGHNNKSNGIWNKMIKAKLGYGHYGR